MVSYTVEAKKYYVVDCAKHDIVDLWPIISDSWCMDRCIININYEIRSFTLMNDFNADHELNNSQPFH